MKKIEIAALLLLAPACAAHVDQGETPERDAPRGASPLPARQRPPCEPAFGGPGAQACRDVESDSHALWCGGQLFGLRLPEGAFWSGVEGYWCWCRPGECRGVLDCRADADCAWAPGTACAAGACEPPA